MEIVLATKNMGKVKELERILDIPGLKVLSLSDYPDMPEVIEDGETFAENAAKKAAEIAIYTKKLALADDSGLEVDYLDGAPGVHSARFAGVEKNDEANNQKLLLLLEGVPTEKRTCRFKCAIAVAKPEGEVKITEGTCEGIIGITQKGDHGFGYDPLFIVPEYNLTFAELDLEVKNKISHRGKALSKVVDEIKTQLNS
jgi:XTP/dITP diphosphohydrolase